MTDIVLAGLILLVAGVAVVIYSMASSEKGNTSVKGGGVVLVGPIPIVFGSDAKWATVAIALAIVLTLLLLLVYVR